MSTQLAPVAADLASAATPRPQLVHVVCCDENLAMCGTDVTTEPWVPSSTQTDCDLCAVAEDNALPCGNPDCPRSAIREGA